MLPEVLREGGFELKSKTGGWDIKGGNGGTTTIYGGTVYADGGGFGAGIGGGWKGNGGTTTIYGGTVDATGGKCGAGIGGGYAYIEATDWPGKEDFKCTAGGNGGTTTITGGTVTANGGENAAGIGGGGYGNGGTTTIAGGTVTAKGGKNAENIGHGKSETKSGTTKITGGNVKGYSNHTITLEGVTDEVEVIEVVGINGDCTYGINDVKTLDKGKLYFRMSNDEYKKLTAIKVRDTEGNEKVYSRDGSSDNFVARNEVIITGVAAQDGVYNGSPQTGYTGTPTNEQGYNGKYEETYYYLDDKAGYVKTTPENSGAEGEGKAPAYAGDYIVRISIPLSDKNYGGYCDLEFKIEKATPEIVKQPMLVEYYGTAVKNMGIVGGIVKVGDMEIEGEWTVTDSRGSDVPEIGTTESYEVTFTPIDTRNYNSVTTMLVPIVVSIPTPSEPTLAANFDKENKQKLIEKVKEKLSDPEFKAKLSDPEFKKELKEKILNSELIKTETKDEIKSLLLKNPEFKDKVRDKISNSELIEDEEVREKLLGFVEE